MFSSTSISLIVYAATFPLMLGARGTMKENKRRKKDGGERRKKREGESGYEEWRRDLLTGLNNV